MQSRIIIVGSRERTPAFQQAFSEHFQNVESFPISKHELSSIYLSELELRDIDGLIITSALAVESFQEKDLSKFPPFYCVGEKSTESVTFLGGTVALTGQGSATDLAKDIVTTKGAGHFVHLAGSSAKIDWYSLIKNSGGSVKTQVCYEVSYKEKLSPAEIQSFRNLSKDIFVFLSEAALTTTQNLFINGNIDFSSATAVCLSEDISKHSKGWSQVLFANTPTKEDLISKVKQEISTSGSL
ncbi:MAG: uroporphyrinogen-III synthase [Pseudomonadota bacterium]|nr:uroporphyrinogen-III synthase [Pseudomonadota bacterium]